MRRLALGLFGLLAAIGGLACVPGGGGGGGSGGAGGAGAMPDAGGPGQALDERCVALCEDEDPVCADAVNGCRAVCAARIDGLEGLCRACLLEDANGGACAGGATCCPDPEFPTSTLDCAEVCAEQPGAAPADPHPLCLDVCSDEDPACAEDAAACLAECARLIEGVSGYCATCLLEEANGGACAGGASCCPSFSPGRSVLDCVDVCD